MDLNPGLGREEREGGLMPKRRGPRGGSQAGREGGREGDASSGSRGEQERSGGGLA